MTSKKNKEVVFSLTKDSAEKVSAGLLKAKPGDKVTIEALDATLCIDIKDTKSSNGNWKNVKCWFKGLIPFARSGHNFLDIERYKNKTITLSRCEICGKINISWE